jgi:hypothetical protein
MAGARFGIDATRCRPALDPADCRRRPNIEKPRRLTCALTRLHDRQYPDPKVLGVSPRHRRPRFCRREHTNLICEPKGIPCNFSDSHQTESALDQRDRCSVFAVIEFDLTKIASDPSCGPCPWTKNPRGPCARSAATRHTLVRRASSCARGGSLSTARAAGRGPFVCCATERATTRRPTRHCLRPTIWSSACSPSLTSEPSANCGRWCAQALATFFTPVAFEAEVRDGARMQRAWTDHGLKLGCGARRADASSAATNVTNCSADEGRNLPAPAVAAP